MADPVFVSARSGEQVVVITAIRGEPGTPGNQANPQNFSFNDSDLSPSGELIKSHGLGRPPVSVRIIDPAGYQVEPDRVREVTTTIIAIDLNFFRPLLAGAWQLTLL